jgi:hypothetical protein
VDLKMLGGAKAKIHVRHGEGQWGCTSGSELRGYVKLIMGNQGVIFEMLEGGRSCSGYGTSQSCPWLAGISTHIKLIRMMSGESKGYMAWRARGI